MKKEDVSVVKCSSYEQKKVDKAVSIIGPTPFDGGFSIARKMYSSDSRFREYSANWRVSILCAESNAPFRPYRMRCSSSAAWWSCRQSLIANASKIPATITPPTTSARGLLIINDFHKPCRHVRFQFLPFLVHTW